MSELRDAFEEALDAAEDAKGLREKVTFRAAALDALFGSETEDFVQAPGGEADSTPISISVRSSDITLPITPLEAITLRGKTLAVLSWKPLEGRLDLIIGDPATEL